MMQSEVEPQTSTRVGPLLKNRRFGMGLDIRDVSRSLRVREVYIEAIETGHFEALPPPVCALGFVRSYAELLQLDAEEIVRRYKQENADFPASPLRFPVPVATEAGAPTGAVLLLGAFIVLSTYAAWYVMSAHRVDVAMVAPVPERLVKLLEREDVPASASSAPSVLDRKLSGAGGADETKATSSTTPPPAGNGPAGTDVLARATDSVAPAAPSGIAQLTSVAGRAEALSAGKPVTTVDRAPTPGGRAGHAASAAEPVDRTGSRGADGTRRITLTANADSWVEVRDAASNARLAARLLRHGEVFEVPDKPGLKLLTGNAGGLVVMVNGEVAPPLGKQGMVRRDIDLDTELLRATAGGAGLR